MADYFQFITEDGVVVAIDSESIDVPDEGGVEKAGLLDGAGRAIQVTQETFEQAMTALLAYNARLFSRAMDGLENRPAEAELTFGLKFSGEIGGFLVTKLAGEATYGVRLIWRDASTAR
jgi:hypothetical protein